MRSSRLYGLGASLFALALGLTALPSWAQESTWLPEGFELSGQVALEARGFPEAPAFSDQLEGIQPSGFIEPELRWEDGGRETQVVLTPFFRLDGRDEERTHFDLREGYVRRIEGDWEFLVGASQVFWGVTESRHLVNIVNQIDAVEDIDEEDFLGQPMFSDRPADRHRPLRPLPHDRLSRAHFSPGPTAVCAGRWRSTPTIRCSRATWRSGGPRWPCATPTLSATSTSACTSFHGTGREPDLLPAPDGRRLIPHYSVITQGGVDLQ